MTRLLILGASFLQIPIIQKAKDLGLTVGVVDYNPTAPGIKLADLYFNISTNDEEGVLKVAQEFKPDGIVTMATDMPMRTIAYVSEKLGLTSISYETAVKATDKFEMIKCFEENNIPHPKYQLVKKNKLPETSLDFPFIVKPTDSSGSRGVSLVNNEEEFVESLDYGTKNGRSGNLLLEEYLVGPEVSVEALIYNKKIHIVQITDKLTTGSPHFVELGHSEPSSLDSNILDLITKIATKAIEAIGIEAGAAHVEIIVTPQGPKLVELGARLGGDNITSDLVPLSTGVDMVKGVIEIALDNEPDVKPIHQKGSAIRFFNPSPDEIKNIKNYLQNTEIDYIFKTCFLNEIEKGELNSPKQLRDINQSNDRQAFIIAQGETAEKAIENVNMILKSTIDS